MEYPPEVNTYSHRLDHYIDCWECETESIVSVKTSDLPSYCPFCGTCIVEEEEDNERN